MVEFHGFGYILATDSADRIVLNRPHLALNAAEFCVCVSMHKTLVVFVCRNW